MAVRPSAHRRAALAARFWPDVLLDESARLLAAHGDPDRARELATAAVEAAAALGIPAAVPPAAAALLVA